MKNITKPDTLTLVIIALVAMVSSIVVSYMHYIPLMPHSVLIHALIVGVMCGAATPVALQMMQDRRSQQPE